MSWLDLVIIVGLALSVFSGLRTGLIKSLLSLVGLILGVVLARWFYVPLSERLPFIPDPGLAKIVSFALIVVAVSVVFLIVASILKTLISAIGLGLADALGGAVFGLVEGVLLWVVLLALLANFPSLNLDATIQGSALGFFLLHHTPLLPDIIPFQF